MYLTIQGIVLSYGLQRPGRPAHCVEPQARKTYHQGTGTAAAQ